MSYPGELDGAVRTWLEGRGQGLAAANAAMSARYRAGQGSAGIDLAAYLTTRLPATFAVNARVLAEVAHRRPGFAPRSLADIGAGPGTAGWAAVAQWPEIAGVEQVEATPAFAGLLKEMNAASGLPALVEANVREQALVQWTGGRHDLVLASYVLAEMPMTGIADAVAKLWGAAGGMLVLIEPGTPEGFKRIAIARRQLLAAGVVIVAPCTHHAACPMVGGDWCHFKERVQRSRAHMHAKGASVPFEDEAYSYLVVARDGEAAGGARVLAPPVVNKTGVALRLCAETGLSDVTVPARDKARYKQAKKVSWGDRWTP
ncbi:small ribosomal subunit Rsm22 family protein [Aestuariivirga sp.]|uniref:small ribosomal subunit Rsm22 family protein n=1 Tax=Aestuariivirga sp. TaxID=2650926 RepID=UPI0039E2A5F0